MNELQAFRDMIETKGRWGGGVEEVRRLATYGKGWPQTKTGGHLGEQENELEGISTT